MFYTSVWCTVSENDFRNAVPLELLGKSLQKYNSTVGFTIVVLEGMDLLSHEYINDLKNLGFSIIDYHKEFDEVKRQYANIVDFYSPYERNCFLRWVAFRKIIEENSTLQQFWHLDSDVIMHTSLDVLAEDTQGKTFVLQGCPVLVSVSDMGWFESYEKELMKLNADIIAYSEKAAKEKPFIKINDPVLCNESLYRNPIGSDQDFLEYLVSSKKIMQDGSEEIFNSAFYFIQNILSLNTWHHHQLNSGIPDFRQEDDLIITIGNKKVPFIHYQNTFCAYADVFNFLKKIGIKGVLLKWIMKYKIHDEKFSISSAFKVISKRMRKHKLASTRKQLVSDFNNRPNKIADIMNFIKNNGF